MRFYIWISRHWGILRKAEDKNGRKYIGLADNGAWISQGLIMVYKLTAGMEAYQYFFTSPAIMSWQIPAYNLREYPGGRWFIDNQNKEQRL